MEVRLTENFQINLESIDIFLREAEAGGAFEALLDHLLLTVIPNIERFPAIGTDFLATVPRSAESFSALERLSGKLGKTDVRQYVFGHYLVLYAITGEAIYLLSVRHHRQLSFDLESFWLDKA